MILRYLFVLLFPSLLTAQTTTSIQNRETDESFPIIHLENKAIEAKINTILQLSHLGHLPNQFETDAFSLTKTANQQGGLFYKNHELSNSTLPNVLSISTSGIINYRTIRPFYAIDNFDLSTGNKIFIEDLLTEKGLKLIHQQNQLDAKQLFQQILNKANHSEEEDTTLKNCLENLPSMPIESLLFQLTESGISFYYPECIIGQTIQDQIQINYTFKELNSLFTKYAQSLIAVTQDIRNTKTVKSRLFSGTLGKRTINAFIKNIYPDGSMQLLYWYTNQPKQLIEWYGLMKGNRFELRERQRDNQNNNKSITTALINGSQKNGVLFGTWKHMKTGQTIPFKLILE